RLAELEDPTEIDAVAAELIDRFGALPEEVKTLLEIVAIKALCRRANVEKVDVGPKGLVIGFRDNTFANPAGLIHWIADRKSEARIRPDQSIVLMRDWGDVGGRLKGTAGILGILSRLAAEGQKAAA
ncbi:MAG: TRCF domain-containing protein, partial [Allosphingosinicella sp.]